MKASIESCSEVLTKLFDNTILNSDFPDKLNVADVRPLFKKDDPQKSKNYRPVSILPVVSKVSEGSYINKWVCMFKNICHHILCGYRKGFSIQQALLSLLERWKDVLDQKGYDGAVLVYLSKAFDTLNYDLLIVKLHAYGFSGEPLQLIKSCSTNH